METDPGDFSGLGREGKKEKEHNEEDRFFHHDSIDFSVKDCVCSREKLR